MSSAKRKAWKNKQRAERLMALRAALSMEYDGQPPPGVMKLNATQTTRAINWKRATLT